MSGLPKALCPLSRRVRAVARIGVAVICALACMLSAAQAETSGTSAPLTQAALATLLAQGVQTQQVPAHLRPSLGKAPHDVSLAWKLGCLLGHEATTNSKPCVFGDTRSRTTVVLFGDSHAAAWFAGLNLVSHQQHWRLVFLGKEGCPVADVLVRRLDGVWYHTCVTWRHNMERKIKKLHPDLLLLTSSDYGSSAEPDSGPHTSQHQKVLLTGIARTFRTLRHAADHVAFIANVPTLNQPAYKCVAAHKSDVYPCTIPLSQAFRWPGVRQGDFQLAAANRITAVDPTPWFCTATRCPVIANDILVYRDSQHITPEWSEFLAPMLADALVPLVSRGAGF